MPGKNNTKRGLLLLFIILAIAAAVRYWGIAFGLPHTQCRPDEEFLTCILFSPERNFHPGAFNYPSFYKYLLLIVYACYYLLGLLSGHYTAWIDIYTHYHLDPTVFYLMNRCLVALLGTLTVIVLYKITRELFTKTTAMIAALNLSLAYLHVRDSHFGCVDVPQTFLIMCSVLFIVKSSKEAFSTNYTKAGIFAGLATSTKYAGIILLAPMAVAHLLNYFRAQTKGLNLIFDKRILLFAGAFFSAFFVGTPYSLLDWPNFISDFTFEMRHLTEGHYISPGVGWRYHLRFSLLYGLGWPLFFVSIAGMLTLLKTNPKKAAILYSFPLIYYLLSGRGYTVFARYMVPVIPFLCIGAAVFLVFIIDKSGLLINSRLKSLVTFTLAFIVLIPSSRNILLFNGLMAKRDNRLIAKQWILEHIPSGSAICETGFLWSRLQLSPVSAPCTTTYKMIDVPANRNRPPFKIRIHCRDDLKGPRYELCEFLADEGLFEFHGTRTRRLPEYMVVVESPLFLWSSMLPRKSLMKLLNSYRLKKAFVAVDCSNRENRYDQQDAFYVPFTGFSNIERPGPNIYIYELK